MRIATKQVSFTPFRHEFDSYSLRSFRLDFFAAIGVALFTIPQSIAYSLLAGLPPTAGIFSAIFGAIFTASFCSSRYLIAGPSTGIAILIQSAISDILFSHFGIVTGVARDALVLHILGQIVLIMGLIQIGAAFFNISRLLQFVSRTVMLGYFAGIVIAVVVNQLFYFFGISHQGNDATVLLRGAEFFVNLSELQWMTLMIGCVSLILLIFLRKQKRAIPDALIVLIVAGATNYLLARFFQFPVAPTLKDFGLSAQPFPDLSWPILDFKLINKIFPAAAAIALLSILEVFSVSRSFAARSGKLVQANQDIFGIGTANVVLSFIRGAMPASGSATRTMLNFRFSAQTRLAAILSGLVVAIVVVFCWPLVQLIPLATLAALLLATIPMLVNFHEVRLVLRATQEDRYVFFLTFISCLIFSLDVAFFVGIVISLATYLRRSAIPHLVEYAFNAKGRLGVIDTEEDVHRKVRIIGVSGDLYFASADIFQQSLQEIIDDPNVSAIVLRLNNVFHVDASMCLAIRSLFETLQSTHRHLIISGITDEVWRVFHRTGLVKRIGLDNLYFTDESNPQHSTWQACLHAQELIHAKPQPM